MCNHIPFGSEQETFVRKCRRRVESINETDLWVDGEHMSEQDMMDSNMKESLGYIMASLWDPNCGFLGAHKIQLIYIIYIYI